MSNSITSPYNFVPLDEVISFPREDSCSTVSMDVPFSDGICGSVDFTLTAVTPIMVRRGLEKGDTSFFQAASGGPWAIPGTSVKGMIRNVLEIVTRSRMDRIGSMHDGNRYFSYRDLNNRRLYSGKLTATVLKGGKEFWRPKALAGWVEIKMEEKDGELVERWYLRPCKWCRVHHGDLMRAYNWSYDRKKVLGKKTSKDEESNLRGIKYKYDLWDRTNSSGMTIEFRPGSEDEIHSEKFMYTEAKDVGAQDGLFGEVVFTGQPSDRKAREFVFYSEEADSCVIEPEIVRAFKDANTSGKGRAESWDFWDSRIKSGKAKRIPMFYLGDSRGKVESMGLAMMFKMPFKYGVREMLGNSPGHLSDGSIDLANLLFGYVDKTEALRGRVVFETMVDAGNAQPLPLKTTILGDPKPSYYPNYVQQLLDENGLVRAIGDHTRKNDRSSPDYKTYNDPVKLRGWKRYPVRTSVSAKDAVSSNVSVSFQALPAGTTFKGVLHVHNLRPFELGAVLWSMCWGEHEDLCHSIGLGKPLGYGAVKLVINLDKSRLSDMNDLRQDIAQHSMMEFKRFMDSRLAGWEKGDAMRELLAMASLGNGDLVKDELAYPALDSDNRINQFTDSKNAGLALLPYSKIVSSFKKKIISAPSCRKQEERSDEQINIDELSTKVFSEKEFVKRVKGLVAKPLRATERQDIIRLLRKRSRINKLKYDDLLSLLENNIA